MKYLLGYSAFSNKSFILSAHKKPAGDAINEEHTLFNYLMKPARVRIDHCIGLLKTHFQFFKSARFMLNEGKESMERTIRYIAVCVILHNFLIAENHEVNSFFNE